MHPSVSRSTRDRHHPPKVELEGDQMSDTIPQVIFDHHDADQIVAVSRPCPVCGKTTNVAVSRRRYNKWRHGNHAQVVWPHVDRDLREILISGTHPDCWIALFGEDDDE
jgi:hypothetical protein